MDKRTMRIRQSAFSDLFLVELDGEFQYLSAEMTALMLWLAENDAATF